MKKVKLVYPKINFSVKTFWIVVILIIFSYWIFFIIKNTFFRDENYLQNLSYSKESVEEYNDPYLYKAIWSGLKWENIYIISKFWKSKILNQLQDEFPMVKNIKIVKSGPYSASVRLDFYEPEIVIKLWDRRFAILWNNIFELYSWNTLWNDVFFAELPQYLSWIDSLYWIFHEISQEKFIHDMNFFAESFPTYKRIVYLPWSSMTAIFLDTDQRIYINNQNPLQEQIDNFYMIKEFYPDFDSLNIIDLWSLQWWKIIVQ